MSSAATAFLGSLRRVLIGAGLVAVLVGLGAGWLMARHLAEPLRRAADAARGLSLGKRSPRLAETGVDEVAELGRAFNEMADSLARSEELRAHMVADIAHELRTPLTVIQGNLRAMLDGVYPAERSEVARVYDESLRLGRLVEDLRQLAHAEAGQLSLVPAPIDLPGLLRDTTALFADRARQRGIRVTLRVADDLPVVSADRDRVRQVVANLVENAVRHALDDGTVAVTAEPMRGGVRVVVADDGAGLTDEERDRVFDRFWRAEASRSRAAGGSGLGLAIARQIVLGHGGEIGVERAELGGSAFWFTLPAADTPAQPAAEARVGRP